MREVGGGEVGVGVCEPHQPAAGWYHGAQQVSQVDPSACCVACDIDCMMYFTCDSTMMNGSDW